MITKETLQDLYVIKQFNLKEIGEILNVHPATVGRCLKKFKILKRKTSGFRHKEATLSSIQKEVLAGALLGDGTIDKNQLIYASKSKQHTEFVRSFFIGLLAPRNIKELSLVSQFDKRTNKTYSRYVFGTQANIVFEKIRNIWYKPKKQIPPEIRLTSLVCLIWYLGDGGICKGIDSCHIKLATNCFKKSDLEKYILPQLSVFEPSIAKTDKINQYTIYIPRRKCREFLNFIGPCPFSDYSHKWDILEYKPKKQ